MMNRVRRALLLMFVTCSLCAAAAAQESDARVPAGEGGARLEEILRRAGAAVERYEEALFSIAFTEVWRWEELREDLTPKKSREYVYDNFVVRVEGRGGEDGYFGKVVRRPARAAAKNTKSAGKRDKYEPAEAFDTFLSFLLPKRQGRSVFAFEGEERLDGRRAYVLAHRPRGEEEPEVVWAGMNFRVNNAPTRGRVWIDAENFDVLRFETRLAEGVEFDSPRAVKVGPFGRVGPSRKLKYARADFDVRFRRVQFKDPEQTLLLPVSADSLLVIEGASRPRTRVRRTFTDHRRYVSGVKIIEDAEDNN